jgi:hypothetical protein
MKKTLTSIIALTLGGVIPFQANSQAQSESSGTIIPPMAVPSLTSIRLETIRARDEDLLRTLAVALNVRHEGLLEGTEILFTRVESYGTVFYRMDIQGIEEESRAREICRILEMEQCLIARPGSSVLNNEVLGIQMNPDGLVDVSTDPIQFGRQISKSMEMAPLPTRETFDPMWEDLDKLSTLPIARPMVAPPVSTDVSADSEVTQSDVPDDLGPMAQTSDIIVPQLRPYPPTMLRPVLRPGSSEGTQSPLENEGSEGPADMGENTLSEMFQASIFALTDVPAENVPAENVDASDLGEEDISSPAPRSVQVSVLESLTLVVPESDPSLSESLENEQEQSSLEAQPEDELQRIMDSAASHASLNIDNNSASLTAPVLTLSPRVARAAPLETPAMRLGLVDQEGIRTAQAPVTDDTDLEKLIVSALIEKDDTKTVEINEGTLTVSLRPVARDNVEDTDIQVASTESETPEDISVESAGLESTLRPVARPETQTVSVDTVIETPSASEEAAISPTDEEERRIAGRLVLGVQTPKTAPSSDNVRSSDFVKDAPVSREAEEASIVSASAAPSFSGSVVETSTAFEPLSRRSIVFSAPGVQGQLAQTPLASTLSRLPIQRPASSPVNNRRLSKIKATFLSSSTSFEQAFIPLSERVSYTSGSFVASALGLSIDPTQEFDVAVSTRVLEEDQIALVDVPSEVIPVLRPSPQMALERSYIETLGSPASRNVSLSTQLASDVEGEEAQSPKGIKIASSKSDISPQISQDLLIGMTKVELLASLVESKNALSVEGDIAEMSNDVSVSKGITSFETAKVSKGAIVSNVPAVDALFVEDQKESVNATQDTIDFAQQSLPKTAVIALADTPVDVIPQHITQSLEMPAFYVSSVTPTLAKFAMPDLQNSFVPETSHTLASSEYDTFETMSGDKINSVLGTSISVAGAGESVLAFSDHYLANSPASQEISGVAKFDVAFAEFAGEIIGQSKGSISKQMNSSTALTVAGVSMPVSMPSFVKSASAASLNESDVGMNVAGDIVSSTSTSVSASAEILFERLENKTASLVVDTRSPSEILAALSVSYETSVEHVSSDRVLASNDTATSENVNDFVTVASLERDDNSRVIASETQTVSPASQTQIAQSVEATQKSASKSEVLYASVVDEGVNTVFDMVPVRVAAAISNDTPSQSPSFSLASVNSFESVQGVEQINQNLASSKVAFARVTGSNVVPENIASPEIMRVASSEKNFVAATIPHASTRLDETQSMRVAMLDEDAAFAVNVMADNNIKTKAVTQVASYPLPASDVMRVAEAMRTSQSVEPQEGVYALASDTNADIVFENLQSERVMASLQKDSSIPVEAEFIELASVPLSKIVGKSPKNSAAHVVEDTSSTVAVASLSRPSPVLPYGVVSPEKPDVSRFNRVYEEDVKSVSLKNSTSAVRLASLLNSETVVGETVEGQEEIRTAQLTPQMRPLMRPENLFFASMKPSKTQELQVALLSADPSADLASISQDIIPVLRSSLNSVQDAPSVVASVSQEEILNVPASVSKNRVREDIMVVADNRPIHEFLDIFNTVLPLTKEQIELGTSVAELGPVSTFAVEEPDSVFALNDDERIISGTSPLQEFKVTSKENKDVWTLEEFVTALGTKDVDFIVPVTLDLGNFKGNVDDTESVLASADISGEPLPETIVARIEENQIVLETPTRKVVAPRSKTPISRFAVALNDTFALPFDLSGSGRLPLQRMPVPRPAIVEPGSFAQSQPTVALLSGAVRPDVGGIDMATFFPKFVEPISETESVGSVDYRPDIVQEASMRVAFASNLAALDMTYNEDGLLDPRELANSMAIPAMAQALSPQEMEEYRPSLSLEAPVVSVDGRPKAVAPIVQIPMPSDPQGLVSRVEVPEIGSPEVMGHDLRVNGVPLGEEAVVASTSQALMIRLSYATQVEEVQQRVQELQRNFPGSMLEKGKFFGEAVPASPSLYIVGIQANSSADLTDLVSYMENNNIPYVLSGQSASPLLNAMNQ